MIKTMGTSLPAGKKEEKRGMNKIAHVFLQVFPSFK
jgi:hypothetical protein